MCVFLNAFSKTHNRKSTLAQASNVQKQKKNPENSLKIIKIKSNFEELSAQESVCSIPLH